MPRKFLSLSLSLNRFPIALSALWLELIERNAAVVKQKQKDEHQRKYTMKYNS